MNLSLSSDITSPKEELTYLRLRNPNRLICIHLNINSVRSNFDLLADILKNNIDILIISEAKIDQFFPEGKFQLYGNSEP